MNMHTKISRRAITKPTTNRSALGGEPGQAAGMPKTNGQAAAPTDSPLAKGLSTPREVVPAAEPISGPATVQPLPSASAQGRKVNRKAIAEPQTKAPAPSAVPAAGHASIENQPRAAGGGDTLVSDIVELWRRRQDMLRARQRLELQAQAICRRFVEGDKVAAGKLWGVIKADEGHPLRVWVGPFLAAMVPLEETKSDLEKRLVKLAKRLPVYQWAQGILGLGDLSLAAIVGESGTESLDGVIAGPGDYKSVSALWKRMGLAVIDGGRQRKVTGAAALDHGYNAERRSLMWNIGASLIKAQLRSEKGDDGKRIDGSSSALGELGGVYLARKAYMVAKNEAGEYAERAAKIVEATKRAGFKPVQANLDGKLTPAHIHNDALRYTEKRLLRQLWSAWRQAVTPSGTALPLPATEPLQSLASQSSKSGKATPAADPDAGLRTFLDAMVAKGAAVKVSASELQPFAAATPKPNIIAQAAETNSHRASHRPPPSHRARGAKPSRQAIPLAQTEEAPPAASPAPAKADAQPIDPPLVPETIT